MANNSLQPTVIPLRGLPSAELKRYAAKVRLRKLHFRGLIMSDVGYLFGVWLGGFVFPMIAGYAFLLPAGSQKKKARYCNGIALLRRLRCRTSCVRELRWRR